MKTRKKKKKGNKACNKTLVGLSLLAASAMGGMAPAAAQNVNCFQSLIFGTVTACGGAGTVTVNPAGARSTGGCATVSGPSSRGRCLLIGSFFPVRPMQVSITAPTFTITNGTSNMNVNNFDLNTAGAGPTTTITAFIATVNIGATLNLGANQADGDYSGSATINVNFQ